MTKYRYDIDINKYKYGIELEFINANLKQLSNELQKEYIKSLFLLGHKRYEIKYDESYLDKDCTVSYQEDDIIYGGEISSRLYQNTTSDWSEIEKISEVLKKNNAKINSNCSNHINIELSNLSQKSKFIENLSIIIAKYEKQIEEFYMGDFYLERVTKSIYAHSIGNQLRSILIYLNYVIETDWELKNLLLPIYSKKSGISLKDLSRGRIEIRYPNGTLNKKTIQNNINFSLKLIDALITDRFDLEKIVFELKNYYSAAVSSDKSNFENLLRTISTSPADENDFFTQYEKIQRTKTL